MLINGQAVDLWSLAYHNSHGDGYEEAPEDRALLELAQMREQASMETSSTVGNGRPFLGLRT